MNSKLSAEIRRVLRGHTETTPHLTWAGPGTGGRLARVLAAGALLGILMPLPAGALQLGPVTAHSALSEPLDARVALVTREPADLEQLKVGLAGKEHFDRAGIPRDPALGRLRFRLAEDADGNPVIRVTTHAAFREPVLTFLLEVVNARTHMVREYSMLLDPPVYSAPVRTATGPAPAARTADTAATPMPTAAIPAPAPVRSAPPAGTTAAEIQRAAVPAPAKVEDDARARREALAGLARDMARLRERIETRREEGDAISKRLARVEKNISGLREVIARQQQAMEALQARIEAMPPVTRVASAPAAAANAKAAVPAKPSAEAAPVAAPATAPAAVPVLGEAAPSDAGSTSMVASLPAQIQAGLSSYALEALLGLAAVGLLGWALALRARLSRLQESDGEDALADIEPAAAEAAPRVQVVSADAGAPSAPEPVEESVLEEDGESSDAIPFSEAAVYHAYGDYDQAESLLAALVDKHPDSEQYRLALLRVLHEARRTDAFQKHARALQRLITEPATSETWQEAVEMSQELKVDLSAADPAGSPPGFVKTVVLADRPTLAPPDNGDGSQEPDDLAFEPDLDADNWSMSLEDVPTVDPDATLIPVATMELGDTGEDALVDVEPEQAARELAAAGLPEPEGDDEETDVLDWADNLLERHAHQDEESVEIEDDELAQSLVLELELEPMGTDQAGEGDLDLTATANLKASSG